MHSAEPIEPHYLKDPCDQASADEGWRAEVASRVDSYRARRQHQCSDGASPDLSPANAAENFDAASCEFQNGEARSRVTGQSEKPQSGEARSSSSPARNAFDTNYYRRLNAESRAQSSRPAMATTGAATASAYALPADELDVESAAKCNAGMGENLRGETCNDPALDMEICPAVVADQAAEDAAEVSFLERYCISEPESELESEPVSMVTQSDTQPTLPLASAAQGNLIVFRRPFLEPPLVPQPSRDELAEPVNKRPRILEVPEDIMPAVQASLFPEIRLDADEQEEASDYREPEFEVPLRVARLSERLIASFADMSLVMAAGMLFAAMAWHALPEVPHTKPFFMMLGAVTLLLWAVYQHLFLLCAGQTPGMRMRGIRLRTFDGQVPQWKQRSSRARYMFISFASVALGFLWALVDEDTLCWHDRISKTFLTTE